MSKVSFTDAEITQEQKFVEEREFVLKKTEEYISADKSVEANDSPAAFTDRNIKERRQGIKNQLIKIIDPRTDEAVLNKAFDKILGDLEEIRDLKSNIAHKRVVSENNIPILIRDARQCKEPPVKSTEAFEMQYLNAVKGAIDIFIIETKEATGKDNIHYNLKNLLLQKAVAFNEKIENLKPEPSQKELSKLVKTEIKDIAAVMEQNGITDAYKKLNVAKDFQNFNHEQTNIVTISTIKGRTVIEAEIGFRELSEEQKTEYQNIAAGQNQPPWFYGLSKSEQQLMQKYASIIAKSKHVISTQLRQAAGMRNAFEKTTAIIETTGENKDKLKILHTSKHAGTLASLNKDKMASKAITTANALQARLWIGMDKVLHCNTLNAGTIGSGADPKIVSDTTKVMKDERIGGKITNTSFNAFRLLGIANNYDGVQNSLRKIAGDNQELVAHLKPRSKLNVLLGLGKPKSNLEEVIGKITADKPEQEKLAIKTIYQDAAKLKQSVEKANVPFRLFFDRENINAEVSTRLNLLTKKIAKNADSFPKLQEEMLTMCASGKDRTGLAMHDQTAQIIVEELNKNLAKELTEIITGKLIERSQKDNDILYQRLDPKTTGVIKQELADKLKIDVKDIEPKLFTKGYSPEEMAEILTLKHGTKIQDIDRELLKNGHTAQQAGGINAGGGTIGCFGTKKENEAGIPISRKKNLQLIIEESAATNKIKGENQAISQARLQDIRQANAEVNKEALAQTQLQVKKSKYIANSQQPKQIRPSASLSTAPIKKSEKNKNR